MGIGNSNVGKLSKKHNHFQERLKYVYTSKLKKWMYCPACQHGKMSINKKSSLWVCEACGYELSLDSFYNDHMFWFCNECNSYLNNQDGFDRQSSQHICKNCGYENETVSNNTKELCSNCGTIIPVSGTTLCNECKQVRQQKVKEGLISLSKVVGIAVAALGAVYLFAQNSIDESNSDHISFPDVNDGGESKMKYNYSRSWFRTASDSELDTEREKVRIAFCSEQDLKLNDKLYMLLKEFDEEISKRAWAGEEPKPPSYRREHGWYLPNDE